MSTKVKPYDIDPTVATNGQVLKFNGSEYAPADESGGSGTDIGNNYLILTGTMAGTPPEVDIADTRITDTTPYLVFYETQPVGNITRTLTNGNLNIVSDDNADTLDVKVLFRNIGPARNYMKGNETLTGAGPRVISDPRFTATTPAMIMPRTTPVGYITATTGAGTMTINSTGTEVGVVVDYIVTLDTTNYSDGMPYNATLDDDDMLFRKSAVSGEDEAVKWSDMKGELNVGSIIAGTVYTAGTDGNTYNVNQATYTLQAEYNVNNNGIYRNSFSYLCLGGTGDTIAIDIRVNGISVQEYVSLSGIGGITVTTDITLNAGDVVSIYGKYISGFSGTVPVYGINFKFTLDYSTLITLI